MYTAQERISAMLERDYREKMPYKIVEQVLRTGIFTASGKSIDYRGEVEEALAPLRSATLRLLSEKWQRGTTVYVIYLRWTATMARSETVVTVTREQVMYDLTVGDAHTFASWEYARD